MTFDIREHSHRRLNVLTGEWVQVSPHRSKRPWQGAQEEVNNTPGLTYDPTCYLCPGNKRSTGEVNPQYKSTYTFTNDFAAITDNVPEGSVDIDGLIIAKSERGICKVICFSPDHSLTIPEMDTPAIADVIREWMKEFQALSSVPDIRYIQIFENKGSIMGCSNPHPHGQIWAQESVPVEPRKKQFNQQKYYEQHGTTLLSNYVKTELEKNERLVFENEHFVSLVPFWAVWPFETMIIPKRPMQNILEMTDAEVASFAAAYKATTVKYDNLFETSFPYSAGLHQSPCDEVQHPEWHWHMSFYPPLLRSATVKKFMVGYEMLANPQRDISPEFSAERLRALPTIHYKQRR